MTVQEALDSLKYELYEEGHCSYIKEELEIAIKALESKINENAWHILTDDEYSYPECFEYVLIEDEFGDKNVACCDPDYEWYISNGEDGLNLIGEVIKWKRL